MATKKTRSKYLPFPVNTSKWLTGNLPFIFFLTFLSVIYIANARYAEYKVRKIQTLQKEIQKLNWEYMSLKSNLMINSMESEVSEDIAKKGLKPLKERPQKIVVKKKDFQ